MMIDPKQWQFNNLDELERLEFVWCVAHMHLMIEPERLLIESGETTPENISTQDTASDNLSLEDIDNTFKQEEQQIKQTNISAYPQDTETKTNNDSVREKVTDNKASPVSIPDPFPLPNPAEISKALLPLARRIAGIWKNQIDIDATVEQTAEANGLITVAMKAPLERQYEIHLFVDVSPSMQFWDDLTSGVATLFRWQGFFRDVRVWRLNTSSEKMRLYSDDTRIERDLASLITPRKNRVFMVITDTLGKAWRSDDAYQQLAFLGKTHSVTIAHIFPQYLWSRTSLFRATQRPLTAEKSGWANSQLQRGGRKLRTTEDIYQFPILNLLPEHFATWAKFLTNEQSEFIQGVILKQTDSLIAREKTGKKSTENIEAEYLLREFLLDVTPPARKLAQILAAVPLIPPVMRLAQKQFLEESEYWHLAEVFFSGLLKRSEFSPEEASVSETWYEFLPGIRELLLASSSVMETTEIWREIGSFVEEKYGSSRSFQALMPDPTGSIEDPLSDRDLYFAEVDAAVFMTWGGKYALRAQELRKQVEVRKQKKEDISSSENNTLFPEDTGEALRGKIVANYAPKKLLNVNVARDLAFTLDSLGNSLSCIYSGYTIQLEPEINISRDAIGKSIYIERPYPQRRGSKNFLGDVHTIFPCKSEVNIARRDFPFAEIPNEQVTFWFRNEEQIRSSPEDEWGKYSKLASSGFEPREAAKGKVSRAMFYAYTFYQEQVDRDYFEQQKQILRKWHREYPPTEAEIERSRKVANSVQGNHNPFVLDLTLVERIYTETPPVKDIPWKLQQSIENNQGQVNCLVFSPNEKIMASAGHDGSICLWNLEGELIANFEGHQDRVWSIAFSTDGNLLVSGSHDGRVFLWDVKGIALIDSLVRLEELQQNVYGIAFHPNMKFVASAGQSQQIDIWDIVERQNIDGRMAYSLEDHQGIISSIVFSSDGKLLASCSDDHTIKIWNWQTQELIITLRGHRDWVNAIAFSPDGKSLISASSDLTLRLWNVDGNLVNVFEGHTDSISSVAFHPGGDIIASGSRDGTVKIWNLQGDCLEVLTNEHQTNVRTVAFNPHGTILAIGGENQPINLYSQETSKLKTFIFEVATIAIKLDFKIVTLVPKDQINNRPKPEDIYFQEDSFSDASSTKGHYQSYQELSNNEQEGIDYRIRYRQENSDITIVAHHGGKIQRGSTEIADAIAGKDYSFYTFEGLKKGYESDALYIPSHKFDEPQVLDHVSKTNHVITIHGLFGNDELIDLGGLDNHLKEQIKQSLEKAGFTKIGRASTFPGTDPNNICNRGKTGKGIQIGISWGLRKKLFNSLNSESDELALFDRFIQAIRDALSPLEAAGLRSQITNGEADYYTEELNDEVELEMISIPGGSFTMGSPASETDSYDDERPQHQVTVPSFYMGRYPITQAQWKAVAELEAVERELDPDPSNFKEDYEGIDRWTRPVEQVSWEDAQEFCARLSQKTGKKYRLPTESEWEYACRAGTTTPFHFGETINTDLANYNGSVYGEGVEGESRGQTTPVGYFKVANNFGLSDMHGNLWEWCEDGWHENYKDSEDAPNDGSAWASEKSSNKVIRGGSWGYYPHFCRSAIRGSYTRDNRDLNFGFRVVCVAPRTT